ncbi:MAG: KH domain-containing protein [Coriobacteriia bacterium]|nr:KH domain-containing protein [Coriobacteriia bacterium]
MAHSGADTEGLVKFLIESLVDSPEAVQITVTENGDTVRFEVALEGDDVGKVIGRGGRIIKAIRTLARAAGSAEGRHVEVDIVG